MRAFVSETIRKAKPWTDPDFPPNLKSLYDCAVDQVECRRFASYEWKRASVCYDKPHVFEKGISPNDIIQGTIGDCYFLAVLSVIADNPNRIRALIET